MDLRRAVRLVVRWAPLVVILALIAAVPTFLFLSGQPPTYESSATLRLGQSVSGAPILNPELSNRIAVEYAFRATTDPVLDAAAESAGINATASDLKRRVTAEAALDSALLTVKAQADTPEAAAALAGAVADRLVADSLGAPETGYLQRAMLEQIQGIGRDIEEVRTTIDGLRSQDGTGDRQQSDLAAAEDRLVALLAAQANYLDALQALGASSLTSVVDAVPPRDAVSSRAFLFTGLAAGFGILVALAIAFIIEFFDDSLRDERAMEGVTGLPVLGSITESRSDVSPGDAVRLVMLSKPGSRTAEAFRGLRANIDFATDAQRLGALLVTSPTTPVGKTATAANLAVSMAQTGRRVTLVDADLRRPQVHRLFNVSNDRGLMSLLLSPDPVRAYLRPTPQPNLKVLTTGPLPPNPTDLLGSPRMRQLVSELLAETDELIIDSPPLSRASDALVLSSFAASTILVVDMEHARRDPLDEAVRALSLARANVIGTVMYKAASGSTDLSADALGPARQPQPENPNSSTEPSTLGRAGRS